MQLQKFKSGAIDSKIMLFSKIVFHILLPSILKTLLSKYKITHLCFSAHCLNIEQGRYNKPRNPSGEIVVEGHFFLFLVMNTNI